MIDFIHNSNENHSIYVNEREKDDHSIYVNEREKDESDNVDFHDSKSQTMNHLWYKVETQATEENKLDDITEVIIIGNITELERMPRNNEEYYEGLEEPYLRLQAQYGGWENAGAGLEQCLLNFFVCTVLILLEIVPN